MRSRGKQWIGFLVMVVGACLLLGPFLLGEIESRKQADSVAELQEMIFGTAQETAGPAVSEVTAAVPESTEEPEKTEAELVIAQPEETQAVEQAAADQHQDAFYQAALKYNQELIRTHQERLTNLASVENFSLDARSFGLKENAIGTIYIPRLDVQVGLYLGASKDHMASGFAVFGNTSMPLGDGEENVAIAGHRGWRGTSMLRDIQKIRMEDHVYITTPWNTLVYQVKSIEIVTADSIQWCMLQPGKTMISLMTCHPYGKHTHRYIVHAELVEKKSAGVDVRVLSADEAPSNDLSVENVETEDGQALTESDDSMYQEITMVHEDGSRETILMDTTELTPDDREYSTRWSDTLIFAEDRMRPVAYWTAGGVALVGMWLVIVTIRDARKKKRGKR